MKQIILSFLLLSLGQLVAVAKPSITILGTGYVGLVLGAGLAELGHHVICADIDTSKIKSLKSSKCPFFEPNLEPLVVKHAGLTKKLEFTNDLETAIEKSDIIFIAVATPSRDDGSADLQYLYNAFHLICACIKKDQHKIICIKSTVPVGTAQELRMKLAQQGLEENISIVSNPEFLRQGTAVTDFFNPDRTIIGGINQNDMENISSLFGAITQKNPVVFTDNSTSELIKYAANTYLAVRLSFINEIDSFCSKVGANITTLTKALGMDKRIGPYYLRPGPGFGGSCLPKDSRALLYQGNQYNVPMRMIKATLEVNQDRKHAVVEKIKEKCGNDLAEKTIGIIGLSFKPNTDDIRESPAIDIIRELLDSGAHVIAYDDLGGAIENMKKIFPDIQYVTSQNDIIALADTYVNLNS